ncbi:hypothetical protein Q5Y75_06650 [Ruegeria sp. 2205SS24-7]|uniref:hypothetical protein n=1 Tax=Ruegeria discodermiae TaxID=3064389 RepID=UPI00274102F4|nr:hypothetical protein [Ruegeria sp. 2205SS24-7]MDP5216891.1 hypothetical protein [Ruegeria sp. 2205SS24-7]
MLGPNYEVARQEGTFDKAARIISLARTGIAASDSAMNIDLVKDGYRGLLECTAYLASDILYMQPGFEPEEKGCSDEQA